jgi:hypothetical protein
MSADFCEESEINAKCKVQNAKRRKCKTQNAKCKMSENVLKDKSYKFALRIVKLYKHLMKDKSEFVLSKQVLRGNFDWRKYYRRQSRRVENGFCS